MSDFLFVPLRPFFRAALAKRWKVQFRKGLHIFNIVDSKTTYFNENCCIIYIYIYIYIYTYIHILMAYTYMHIQGVSNFFRSFHKPIPKRIQVQFSSPF